jgi:hypothetical protein
MAKIVVIAGETSTGKSTSYCPIDKSYIKIKGLLPADTFIFNIASKGVPMKGGDELYPPMLLQKEGAVFKITKKGTI